MKKLKKAANGLQKIQADQAAQQGLVNTVAGTAAEAALPGIGGAGAGLLTGLQGVFKDDKGLYTSTAGQLADGLNPLTQLNRNVTAVSKVFKGDFLGAGKALVGDQQDLRDAQARQKIQDAQLATWNKVQKDGVSSSQVSQYADGTNKIKGGNRMPTASRQDSINLFQNGYPLGGYFGVPKTKVEQAANADLQKYQQSPNSWMYGIKPTGVKISPNMDGYSTALTFPAPKGVAAPVEVTPPHAATAKPMVTITPRRAQSRGGYSDRAPGMGFAPSEYKGGTKAIEIEGGEPHFSKAVNGKRSLKTYAPTGPSHEQGGIPVLAAEGDAIVTAKDSKGAAAVAAHRMGDHATVEKIIKQMPEDKGNKKATKGVGRVKFTPSPTVLPDGLDTITSPSASYASRMAAIGQPLRTDYVLAGNMPVATAKTAAAPASASKVGNALSTVAQAAPSIYNLGQGLFGNVSTTSRRMYSPQQQEYQDLSGPQHSASNQAMRGSINAARNLSGGNAGNARANATQAFAANADRQGAIDAQEASRKLTVAGQNVQENNRAKLINNQVNDQADALDLQNAAKKQEALANGLSGISALAGNSLLMKNQAAADENSMGYLKQMYKNFTIGPDGKIVKAKKGMKNIKTK